MSTGIEITINDSRGAKIRRGATATLRTIVNGADLVAITGVLSFGVAGALGITAGPTGWGLLLLALLAAGATYLTKIAVGDLAEMLDPDRSDGDAVIEAAAILRDLRDDIANGADPRAVGDALRQANLGAAVGDLVAAVADERDRHVADDHPLREAAINLRDADRLIAS